MDYNIKWLDGEVISLPKPPITQHRWLDGESYLEWDLTEGILFDAVQIDGLITI